MYFKGKFPFGVIGPFLIALLLMMALPGKSQNEWQQRIDYDIRVKLNDKDHFLNGRAKITYFNHSPDTLEKLYFHCWPNAYSSKGTPFARQRIENRATDFFYAEKKAMGFMDSLKFTRRGDTLAHKFEDKHNEMGVLHLDEPLLPDESITIETPFRVKIPKNFSRLGHKGQSYQISQWYPKVAVYDEEGWHAMPYLNQGEFYNDFGQYRVAITLPANYKIGATGKLQNPKEKAKLIREDSITRAMMPFDKSAPQNTPESKDSLKTLVFKQDRVHDFAWFADKRFRVLMDTAKIAPQDKAIITYSFFLPRNAKDFEESPKYISQGLKTLSRQVGPYPYNTFTVVNGAITAGSAMEYPTVTIVSNNNPPADIFHEITHNWFQGVLAFNERKHPLLDEGLTSFYQHRYFENWSDPDYFSSEWSFGMNQIPVDGQNLIKKYIAHHQDRIAKDQAQTLKSSQFTKLNYWAMIYGKTAWLFQYLYGYLGKALFDQAMEAFYQKYQFGHPDPKDLEETFEDQNGQNLDWFFRGLLKERKELDYAIKGFGNDEKSKVRIQNKGELKAPFLLTLFKNDSLVAREWKSGFKGEQLVKLPKKDFDKVRINPFNWVPDHNHRNNTLFRTGIQNLWDPIKPEFASNSTLPGNNKLHYLPALQANGSDGFMLGGVVSNSLLPPQNFEMLVAPYYGFRSKNLVGSGLITYNLYGQNPRKWHNFEIGVKGKRFSYENEPKALAYSKLAPFVSYQFKSKPLRRSGLNTVTLRSNWLWREDFLYNQEKDEGEQKLNKYYVNELKYRFENQNTLFPLKSEISVQQHKDFVKASLELKGSTPYEKKNQRFRWRFFAGKFLHKKDNLAGEYTFLLGNRLPAFETPYTDFRDKQDYLYEQSLLDRGARKGALANQVWLNDGFFKAPTAFGNSRDWLVSLNLMTSIPGKTPLRVFADIGTSASLINDNNLGNISYDAGVALVIWKDVLEFYYPVFFSNDLENVMDNNGINGWDRLQFRLDINPYRWLEWREKLNETGLL